MMKRVCLFVAVTATQVTSILSVHADPDKTAAVPAVVTGSSDRPNILFITMDDMNWDFASHGPPG